MAKSQVTPKLAEVEVLLHKLQQATCGLDKPMSEKIWQETHDPYLVLISCLLSLRARDVVTYKISQALFTRARTPQQILALSIPELEKIIKSIGTYRRKARTLHVVSTELIKRFGGKVPSGEADLLSLPGVGRKTANLVRGIAFGIPAICVDVHVHRIANALGWVHAKNPEETEQQLEELLPRKWWILINHLFVLWGQNHCKPVSASKCAPGCPFMNLCPLVYWKSQK